MNLLNNVKLFENNPSIDLETPGSLKDMKWVEKGIYVTPKLVGLEHLDI